MWLGVTIFVFCFSVYFWYWLTGRVSQDEVKAYTGDKSSEKLFYSKVYDDAFFDGESEDYAEARSRTRIFGGG